MIWAARLLLVAAALAGGFLVARCFGGSANASPPLLVGTSVWIGNEPLYVARELELMPADRVHLVEYSSSTQVRTAFRNGAVDVATFTLDELVLLRRRGFDVRAVLVLDESSGGDALVARAPISDVRGLQGKRVAVDDASFGAYVLTRALQRAGMTFDDVEVVRIGIDQQPKAWARGSIDAAVTIDPQRTEMLTHCGRQIFDSSELPGEILDVLVVRTSVLDDRREEIDLLLAGWLRAVDALETRPAQALGIVSARMHLSIEEVRGALRGITLPSLEENLHQLSGEPSPIELAARGVQKVMLEQGLLDRPVGLSELSDVAPLRRAAKVVR